MRVCWDTVTVPVMFDGMYNILDGIYVYRDYNQQHMNHLGLSDTRSLGDTRGSPELASLLGKMMVNHKTLRCISFRQG